ncbi:MAG: 2-oxoacid:acceptor oxidoreductase family protein [Eubacteriaceae bacterium]|jgi:2-oxoglutarate ferredoxin oxidoreductase subunit gamma|nr:2-oxoacid:acceptor oxidoreductase family protein [Eubacteriaceae bacterium]
MLKEVIFSGFGGQGALLIGQVLAMAGVIEDLNATYRPTYGFEKRGGVAFCDVILSDEEIGTPVIENPEVAVIMDEASFKRFEPLVKKGGAMFYNTSLISSKPTRDDIEYFEVPCNDMAKELGNDKVANMILLGAYVGYSKAVAMDSVEAGLKAKLGHGKEKTIPLNRKALEMGAAIAAK